METTKKPDIPFLLFVIMPFAALVASIRNYRAGNAKNLMWLFIIFYGYTFVISSESFDSSRYKQNLIYYSSQNATSIGDFVQLLYRADTSYVDVLQPLLTFVISRFTSNARILFAFFGLIFGFFFSRNLWFLLSFVENKIKKEAVIFLVLFALMVAIWQINGFRFWTAAHIFVFGLFTMIDRHRLRGILICISSLFVHFSFALPCVVLLAYLILGNRLVWFFLLYFFSFFVSQLSPDILRNYSSSLPAIFQERSRTYISEEYLKVRAKSEVKGNWYIVWRSAMLMYVTNALLIYIFFKYRKPLALNNIASSLLCYGLLLFALSNTLIGVPSVGGRFQIVSFLILFAAIYVFVQSSRKNLFPYWIFYPFIGVACLFSIVEIRIGFDTIGVMTVIGNPFVAPFVQNDWALIELIK